jgi:glycosyltransferase involved in cell wall biosynthesis
MKSQSSPRIMVGMPAFNEGKYIGSIILQARQYTDEIVVADDGSSDQTARVAELAGATVIRHGQNQGYGMAIRSILSEAKKRSPDVLVILDADAQHDPEEIPAVIKPISEGFDLVIGSRKMGLGNIPAYRNVGQGVLSYFTRFLSKEKLSDTECGFRAYSRKAIATLEPREKGMAISAEIVSEASAKGLRVTEVPISAIYTKDGSSLNPITHGLGVLNRIMVMISERRPLFFFGSCGSIAVIVGVILGVMVWRTYYATHLLATGTAMVSVLLVIAGTLSVFTGIILNVLAKR